jgi:hypothetical protein
MTIVRLDRFKADPAHVNELIGRRNALLAAVKQATPGLIRARLTRVDDQTWIDMWEWDTREHSQAAIPMPAAGRYPKPVRRSRSPPMRPQSSPKSSTTVNGWSGQRGRWLAKDSFTGRRSLAARWHWHVSRSYRELIATLTS